MFHDIYLGYLELRNDFAHVMSERLEGDIIFINHNNSSFLLQRFLF